MSKLQEKNKMKNEGSACAFFKHLLDEVNPKISA